MSDDARAKASKAGDGGPSTRALPTPTAEAAGGTGGSRKGHSAAHDETSGRPSSRGSARESGKVGAAAAHAAGTTTGGDRRPSVPRPTPTRAEGRSTAARGPRARRARLALRRIDPWSVFLFSFLGSLCLGVVLLVAVAALYAILSSLGVIGSINDVFSEVTGGGPDSVPGAPLLTAGRALGAAGVLALINVVLLTALATLGALLYNLCASLTGGIELTLAEKE